MRHLSLIVFLFFGLAMFAQNDEKFKPSKDMVSIDALRGELEVKVGTKIYYTGSVHGSVGSTFSIGADPEIKFVRKYFHYNDPKKAEMNGGDAGKETYVYEASKTGEYTVTIKERFRGEVQYTHNVKVKVVE
ncbi:MAG: hypothetical protein R2799_01100 [Crocinitomicaceae bacterium]